MKPIFLRCLKWLNLFQPCMQPSSNEMLKRGCKGALLGLLIFSGFGLVLHAFDDYVEKIFEGRVVDAMGDVFEDLTEPERLLDETGLFEVKRGFLGVSTDSQGLPSIATSFSIRPLWSRILCSATAGVLLGVLGYGIGRQQADRMSNR